MAAWQSGIDLRALFLSVVALLELRLGIALKTRKDEAAGEVLLEWYEQALKPTFTGRVLGVDERIAERCALLRVPVTRPYRDSLIAATGGGAWPDRGNPQRDRFRDPRGRGGQSVGRYHRVTHGVQCIRGAR